eukprot:gene26956-biopygen17531
MAISSTPVNVEFVTTKKKLQ